MLIAGLTLGLGILAVFLAIIYRISATDDRGPEPAAPSAAVPLATIAPPAAVVSTPPAPAAVSAPATLPAPAAAPAAPPASSSLSEEDRKAVLKEAKATVPADARLMSSTVAGDRIVLTYEHFAGTVVLIFDPETLEMVGRLEIKPTP